MSANPLIHLFVMERIRYTGAAGMVAERIADRDWCVHPKAADAAVDNDPLELRDCRHGDDPMVRDFV